MILHNAAFQVAFAMVSNESVFVVHKTTWFILKDDLFPFSTPVSFSAQLQALSAAVCDELLFLQTSANVLWISLYKLSVQVPVFVFGRAISCTRPHVAVCSTFLCPLLLFCSMHAAISVWKTIFSESHDSSSVEIHQLLMPLSHSTTWHGNILAILYQLNSLTNSFNTSFLRLCFYIPCVVFPRALHVHCDCNNLHLAP